MFVERGGVCLDVPLAQSISDLPVCSVMYVTTVKHMLGRLYIFYYIKFLL